jgi:hypothetical protein
MYRFTAVIKLRVSLNKGLMVTSVCNLKCDRWYQCSSLHFLKIGICPSFTNFLWNTTLSRIWLTGLDKLRGCLISILKLQKIKWVWSLGWTQTLATYLSIKIWGRASRKTMLKLQLLHKLKFIIWKFLASCFQWTWTNLLPHSCLQAWSKQPSLSQQRD